MDSPLVERAISDFYVRPRFKVGSSRYPEHHIVNEVLLGRRVLICGKGGSGKTVFLKHLFLQLLTDEDQNLPVLIELRKLNSGKHANLTELCRDSLNLIEGVNGSIFTKLCSRGFFSFIFDGFDEVSRERRHDVESDLLQLARRYPKCRFVVSGRENTSFGSWETFHQYKICDLEFEEIEEIVEKSAFEAELKEQIIDDLKTNNFFDRHSTLLSTPLLVTMLLLTYQRTHRLPKLLTNFYPQVFETLVFLHDSHKESFAREFSLGTDQFRRFFGIFCLISYLKEMYEFSETEFNEYIELAAAYGSKTDVLANISEISIAALKTDLWEASNLLISDDGTYCFLHRSMQEFFAAEALITIVATKTTEILKLFSKRTTDNTFQFAYELSEDRVVDDYFLPERARVLRDLDLESTDPKEIFEMLGLTAKINIFPYEVGRCTFEVDFSNKDLVDFLSSIDLVSSHVAQIHNIATIFENTLSATDLRVPKGLISENGVTLSVTWSIGGEPNICMYDSSDAEVSDFLPERIIDEIQDRAKLTFKRRIDHAEKYITNILSRLVQLESSRQSRDNSIDEILDI
jgi:hypothetical protein